MEKQALGIALEVSVGAALHELSSRLTTIPFKAQLKMYLFVAGGMSGPTGEPAWPKSRRRASKLQGHNLAEKRGLQTKLRP